MKAKTDERIAKFELAGVAVHVLERYGIESYFTQKAMEEVLGPALGSCFPIDYTKKMADGIIDYDKRRGGEIIGAHARKMLTADLYGTDLGEIIQSLRKQVENHS